MGKQAPNATVRFDVLGWDVLALERMTVKAQGLSLVFYSLRVLGLRIGLGHRGIYEEQA